MKVCTRCSSPDILEYHAEKDENITIYFDDLYELAIPAYIGTIIYICKNCHNTQYIHENKLFH